MNSVMPLTEKLHFLPLETTSSLSFESHTEGVDEALLRRVLSTWFSSPYWYGSPWIRHLLASEVSSHIPLSETCERDDADIPILLSLADQYALSRYAPCSLDDFRRFEISAEEFPTTQVRLHGFGNEVFLPINDFLTFLIRDAIHSGYPSQVDQGLLGRTWGLGTTGLVDAHIDRSFFLPTLTGLKTRQALTAKSRIGVPIIAYHAVSILLPERQRNLQPLLMDSASMLTSAEFSEDFAPLSRWFIWHVRLRILFHSRMKEIASRCVLHLLRLSRGLVVQLQLKKRMQFRKGSGRLAGLSNWALRTLANSANRNQWLLLENFKVSQSRSIVK